MGVTDPVVFGTAHVPSQSFAAASGTYVSIKVAHHMVVDVLFDGPASHPIHLWLKKKVK